MHFNVIYLRYSVAKICDIKLSIQLVIHNKTKSVIQKYKKLLQKVQSVACESVDTYLHVYTLIPLQASKEI